MTPNALYNPLSTSKQVPVAEPEAPPSAGAPTPTSLAEKLYGKRGSLEEEIKKKAWVRPTKGAFRRSRKLSACFWAF